MIINEPWATIEERMAWHTRQRMNARFKKVFYEHVIRKELTRMRECSEKTWGDEYQEITRQKQ